MDLTDLYGHFNILSEKLCWLGNILICWTLIFSKERAYAYSSIRSIFVSDILCSEKFYSNRQSISPRTEKNAEITKMPPRSFLSVGHSCQVKQDWHRSYCRPTPWSLFARAAPSLLLGRHNRRDRCCIQRVTGDGIRLEIRNFGQRRQETVTYWDGIPWDND